jgi:hypothetical protein
MFTVKRGVKGAMRVLTKEFKTFGEARFCADRWAESNSQGSYWAKVFDSSGKVVHKVN